ncbi:hypothetical protein FC15_GL000074 [Lapidilactobacillus concavus DSM 17758]|uniref:Glycosyl hydrolases family 39 N-terminal catalytic domain-containing protein n=1 Tax=Lapidilactobacillus concavus DSM 17758 TaxID=1423735 RepID=A0A0R1W5G0_9LACO|nr:hypothetical protein [Lapidilactobacillus concavus]KRM13088.1 hypothetical protein FC15_GL000074 [Lapidilactobacillus concavus DSM 17758]GEL13538.1 beta-xylosidase [Lapidilactobacillus concavus]
MIFDTTKTTIFKKNFLECIGSGHLDLVLRDDYLKSLRILQKEIGFKYLRAHGLFSKNMGIVTTMSNASEDTRITYNFTNLDQSIDNLLATNIKPLLELGFMPDQIARGTQKVFWWEGNVTPPKDYVEWKELIKATLTHMINRYGVEEVKSWPIEVWNEPNLDVFWENADQDEYLHLFAETYTAIKEVNQDLKVGGPAICGGGDDWMRVFLQFCEKKHFDIDFLSRHAYAVGVPEKHNFVSRQDVYSVKSLLDDFKSGSEYISKYYHRQIPVYITEFNTSYIPNNFIHDTAFNAAYLARVLSEGNELADLFSYWTFTDTFEESGIPASFLHGGFGLMTINQVKKPTYYLYQFFSHIGNKEVYKDQDMFIGLTKDNEPIIIAWNPTDEVKKLNFDLRVAPTEAGYVAKRLSISEEQGNIFTIWKKFGMPRFPSSQQVNLFKQLAVPASSIENLMASSNVVSLEFELQANEITEIILYQVSDDADQFDFKGYR